MNKEAQAEMPRYQSHKIVHALQILTLQEEEDGTVTLFPVEKEFSPFKLSPDYLRKHAPASGGYYVVYPDGYTSFSPADAFESGYFPIK